MVNHPNRSKKITKTETRPGWLEIARDGKVIEIHARYEALSHDLAEQIWVGPACGHPSNRPKSDAQARAWTWFVTPDGSRIIGYDPHVALIAC